MHYNLLLLVPALLSLCLSWKRAKCSSKQSNFLKFSWGRKPSATLGVCTFTTHKDPSTKNPGCAPVAYTGPLNVSSTLSSSSVPVVIFTICLIFCLIGKFCESDIAKSLLFMISNDIGQVCDVWCLMFKITSLGDRIKPNEIMKQCLVWQSVARGAFNLAKFSGNFPCHLPWVPEAILIRIGTFISKQAANRTSGTQGTCHLEQFFPASGRTVVWLVSTFACILRDVDDMSSFARGHGWQRNCVQIKSAALFKLVGMEKVE